MCLKPLVTILLLYGKSLSEDETNTEAKDAWGHYLNPWIQLYVKPECFNYETMLSLFVCVCWGRGGGGEDAGAGLNSYLAFEYKNY